VTRNPSPVVSVLVASRDASATLPAAVASLLAQTGVELETIVVDDGSVDATPEILAGLADERLVVLRNDAPQGLSRSLNRALDAARGRYVARLDADDVAAPGRLARQVERMRRGDVVVVGTAVLEIDAHGAPGRLHRAPRGPAAVAWGALFGSPFFHPTTLIDRAVLGRHDLRYDPRFDQAQDYDLWARLLEHGAGDNLPEPLVFRRVHAGQVTRRRGEAQRAFVREIALRQIARVAPELSDAELELAWSVGAGAPLGSSSGAAVEAYLELYRRFSAGRPRADLRAVRVVVSRAVLRAGLAAPPGQRLALMRSALAVDPALPLRGAHDRLERGAAAAAARRRLAAVSPATTAPAPADGSPVRVTVVLPEPTPYRTPLLDRLAARPELDLTVLYAAETVADRAWEALGDHPAVVLDGRRVPGARRLVHHDYTVTPRVFAELRRLRPDVVVVNGWSTFTAQAALAWCRRRRVPYVLLASSHDAVERAAWRRAVRKPVVPPLVRGAAGVLALGTLSREALVALGAPPDRVRLFANTIDVDAWAERADAARPGRAGLRSRIGLDQSELAVLFVGRLSPEKNLETLVRAAGRLGPDVAVVLAGAGPERERTEQLGHELGVRLVFLGDVPHDELVDVYVAADVLALLSTWERWGVVVNEAAACGLPLVLSDRVGAAPDLLRNGENGALVAPGDVDAIAAALERYRDPEVRAAHGTRSREIAAAWGYEPSVEAFVELVLDVREGRLAP
jgi:glycosyltransferase involved in cell wall biosynthesis